MLGRSDRCGNRTHEHDSVPIRILMRGMFVCALLVLGGYLLFVNTRWGQMVDDAAYSGRHIVAPALIKYDHLILDPVSASTLVVAMALILMAGAFRRCLAAAAIIAVGFACAVAGAELLKHALPWHALLPRDSRLPLDLQRQPAVRGRCVPRERCFRSSAPATAQANPTAIMAAAARQRRNAPAIRMRAMATASVLALTGSRIRRSYFMRAGATIWRPEYAASSIIWPHRVFTNKRYPPRTNRAHTIMPRR